MEREQLIKRKLNSKLCVFICFAALFVHRHTLFEDADWCERARRKSRRETVSPVRMTNGINTLRNYKQQHLHRTSV